jgi:hypothetical protein
MCFPPQTSIVYVSDFDMTFQMRQKIDYEVASGSDSVYRGFKVSGNRRESGYDEYCLP